MLAEAGIQFTILAPHQVERPSEGGVPLRFRAANGSEIALCIYDAALSGEIAFGRLIAEAHCSRIASRPQSLRLEAMITAAAMDGETFGHHHRFGEMALARAFRILGERDDVRIENFASFLARNPPVTDAVLVSPELVELLSRNRAVALRLWMQVTPEEHTARRGAARCATVSSGSPESCTKFSSAKARSFSSIDPWECAERYGE